MQAGVTEAVVDNYRLPQLVHGWEAGLLAFLRARVVAGKHQSFVMRGTFQVAAGKQP